MRFLLVTVLLCMICLSYGQQQSSNPITNFFTKWFRRPSTAEKHLNAKEEVADPLTKEDFESQLARGPNDRMINDAITAHILAESREQSQFVDSPFIQSPKEELFAASKVATDDRTSLNNGLLNVREGAGKSMAANTVTDTIPLTEALRIVNSSNLIDCVARVICELSCNANAYGDQGRTVFRNLIKLQFDQSIKPEDAKVFRQAAAKGRQVVQGKKSCNECYTIYPQCKSSSKDLVAVSSMFKL